MSNSDLMGRMLLGQPGQRGQGTSAARALAARLMEGTPPAAPLLTKGAALASALANGINQVRGGWMEDDADRRDAASETARFQRFQTFETARTTREQSEMAALLNPGAAPAPAMGGAPAMPDAMPSPMPMPAGSAMQPGTAPAPVAAGGAIPPPGDPGRNGALEAQRDALIASGASPQQFAEASAARGAYGAPQIPGGYRSPDGVGGVYAGLPPPSGVINPNVAGDAPRAAPAAAHPGMPPVTPDLVLRVAQAAGAGSQQAATMLPFLQQQLARTEQNTFRSQDREDRQRESADNRAVMLASRPTPAPQTVSTADGMFLLNRDGSLGTRLGGLPRDVQQPNDTERLLAAAGLQPGTPEHQAAAQRLLERRGSPPTTNVSLDTGSRMGAVPPGMEVVIGADGRNEMRPIRGSDADRMASGAAETATRSLGQIDAVLGHPALETATGITAFTGAIPGSPMMDFRNRVDQLTGRAFLHAFEILKGGGQITEVEGRKATDAIARLSRSVSASDFRTALGELREVISSARDRAGARGNAGAAGAASPPGAPIGVTGLMAEPPQRAQSTAPVRVASPAEAARLPPGTAILLPDGSIGRVPSR